MPLSAFLLVLAAAVLHAGWNVILARADDVAAATTVALSMSVLLFAPVAALTWDVDASAVPWIAASAVLEIAYFALLTTAYSRSDLTLVYPVARGSAPVLVLVGAAVVGATVGWVQAIGVVLVGGGIVLVRGLTRKADPVGVIFGLVLAGFIAAYTLVDKHGIRYAAPFVYLELSMILPGVGYALVLARLRGWRSLAAEVRPATALAGFATFGAYGLVLAALARAPAASVAAIRETSIVIAAGFAAFVLREQVGVVRLGGAVLVASGVALISL